MRIIHNYFKQVFQKVEMKILSSLKKFIGETLSFFILHIEQVYKKYE